MEVNDVVTESDFDDAIVVAEDEDIEEMFDAALAYLSSPRISDIFSPNVVVSRMRLLLSSPNGK